MRTSYKTLMNDEFNVLNVISSRTKMDCWFCLKQDKNCTDYVWDIESRRRMSLKTGIALLAEGLDYYDIYSACKLNAFEDLTFRRLLKKLHIAFDIPYGGPSVIGMTKKEFVDYCAREGVPFNASGGNVLVGDRIYAFSYDGKCRDAYELVMGKDERLASRAQAQKETLEDKIAAAESRTRPVAAKAVFRSLDEISK